MWTAHAGHRRQYRSQRVEVVCSAKQWSAVKRTLLEPVGISRVEAVDNAVFFSKEGRVRKMLQTGSIVGHDIGASWDEEVCLCWL